MYKRFFYFFIIFKEVVECTFYPLLNQNDEKPIPNTIYK
jgi:hypothetical protein